MSRDMWKWSPLLVLVAVAAFALVGCEQSATPKQQQAAKPEVTVESDPSRGGWWCVEHSMPEGVCAQCSTQLAADFQKKGDWCKEHSRPESQCFICHPELEAKFAAQYVAKFGDKPPKRTE